LDIRGDRLEYPGSGKDQSLEYPGRSLEQYIYTKNPHKSTPKIYIYTIRAVHLDIRGSQIFASRSARGRWEATGRISGQRVFRCAALGQASTSRWREFPWARSWYTIGWHMTQRPDGTRSTESRRGTRCTPDKLHTLYKAEALDMGVEAIT